MSEVLGDFHFLRPLWLLALLGLPILWFALRRADGDGQAWRGAVDAHLLRHLLEREDGEGGRTPHWLLAAAWLLACMALAGPAWERVPQPLFQNKAARVIALDLAPTMLAQDVKPSRVERARYKIADILRRSGDAQTALIAYAGDAFVVAPLTDDSNTVANLVDALEPSIMPVPGNDAARAIDLGARLVSQAGLREGEVLLVADAADGNAVAAAAKARAAGVRVSVLGIGTEQGAPVAIAAGGFLKDSSGNIAMPKLDAAALASIATAGGGRYASYSADGRDLDAVLDDLGPRAADEASATNAQTSRFLDRGPWLLLALLPLAALGFRRGWLMLLPIVLLVHGGCAQAMSWEDLWSRRDQRARAALDAGDPKQAQALARDPQLRGAAAFRAEDYDAAVRDFDRPDSAEAQYNLGNSLAKQNKFADALAAYDHALKLQPDMEDALANRKAIEDWLKQQQKQKGKSGQGQNDKNEQRQSGDDKDSQSAPGDQQQESDRQNGEQQNGDDQRAQNRQSPDQQDGEQKDGQDSAQSTGESQGQKDSSSARRNQDNDQANAGKAGAQPESKNAEQQAQQQFQQSMDQALKNAQQPKEKDKRPVRLGAREGTPNDEKQQAVEQWLQRVPDDPGGLLRRKFQLENQRRQQGGDGGGNP